MQRTPITSVFFQKQLRNATRPAIPLHSFANEMIFVNLDFILERHFIEIVETIEMELYDGSPRL